MDKKEKENPDLHLLYTKWAVVHLATIEKCKKMLSFGNINMIYILNAMEREKNKLINENSAYKDAAEILESLENI